MIYNSLAYIIQPSGIPEARMQVSKWGNSLAVRLPAKLVEAEDWDAIAVHARRLRLVCEGVSEG